MTFTPVWRSRIKRAALNVGLFIGFFLVSYLVVVVRQQWPG
jgi:hypothetical protein